MRKSSIEYAIIPFYTVEDIENNPVLSDNFFEAYHRNLNTIRHQETSEQILDRMGRQNPGVTDKIFNSRVYLLGVEITSNGVSQLIGGCVIEFYRRCNFLEIKAIFIDPAYRGSGLKVAINQDEKHQGSLAEALIKDEAAGLPALAKQIENDYPHAKIKTVVVKTGLESTDQYSVDDLVNKVHFFRKLGAKLVTTNYIDPILEKEKNRTYLLTIPFANQKTRFLSIEKLMSYSLETIYCRFEREATPACIYSETMYEEDVRTLKLIKNKLFNPHSKGVNGNGKANEFHVSYFDNYRVGNDYFPLQEGFTELLKKVFQGSNKIYLEELPRPENPKFNFKRASITVQVLVDEDYFKPVSNLLTIENGHWVKDIDQLHQNIDSGRPQNKSKRNNSADLTGGSYENIDYDRDLAQIRTDAYYCPVCHSYETDLFSYQYHVDPPYYTKVFQQDLRVIMCVPRKISFTSEGRVEVYYRHKTGGSGNKSNGDSWYLPLRLFVSYTYFGKSNIRIWNLSFSPTDEVPVDEFTLIKLSKFFTGTQESKSIEDKNRQILDSIRFAIIDDKEIDQIDYEGTDDLNFYTLTDLFFPTDTLPTDRNYWDVSYQLTDRGKERFESILNRSKKSLFSTQFFDPRISYKNIKTGILHVDLNEDLVSISSDNTQETWREDLEEIFQDLYNAIKNRNQVKSDGNTLYQEDNFRTAIANMLCGTTLGIFDFDRMGPEEIEDTLSPRPASVTESSFLTINRGALSAFYTSKDDVLDAAWDSLGASPYLLIPSAVLSHNEYVTLDAEDQLSSLLQQIKLKEVDKNKIDLVVQQRNQISDLLNEQYLPNVFHYKTERDLYQYGSEHRGIFWRFRDTIEGLKQLDIMIEQLILTRNEEYHQVVQIGLGAIAVTTLLSFIKDLYLIKDQLNPYPWIMVGIMAVYVAWAGIVAYQYRRSKKSTLGTGNYVLDN